MTFVTFSTPEEQATGLLRYAHVPQRTVFLFPNVAAPVLTTGGMQEPIRVVFLNDILSPIRVGFSIELIVMPNEYLPIPSGTKHVVEAGQHTSILANLAAVRQKLLEA